MPRVLAVVPARAGSKRLPGKNLRTVAGISLIGWAVTAAKQARLVDDTIVSTDDPAMLREGIRYGAWPLQRPPELATDEATTDSVLVHACEKSGWAHDLVVLLQPTVPGRRIGLVDECIERLRATGADSVFTGRELHFVWKRRPRPARNGGGELWHQANASGRRIARQEFVPADERYEEDGAVFVCRAGLLRKTGARIGGRIEIVPNERTVDIDTAADLAAAEALMQSRIPFVHEQPKVRVM